MPPRLVLFAGIFVLSTLRVGAVDPLDEIVRGAVYTAKDVFEKTLLQLRTPKIGTTEDGRLSFQVDVDDEKSAGCSSCRQVPREAVVGTWYVALWSRNFLLTSVTYLDTTIDRLAAGQTIYPQRNLLDWIKDPPDVRCAALTILDDTDYSKFEFGYRLPTGRQKSIIGSWERTSDGRYFWRMSPILSAELCVAYGHHENGTTESDFLVFNQVDSFPSCSNYIALTRGYNPETINRLRDFLEQQRVEGAFNKLERIPCENAPQS
ncbi:Protein R08A2.5 a [Aphelenchoides avenae]|nr:Protein R08A2.5 a [Aphelenchus avenae]